MRFKARNTWALLAALACGEPFAPELAIPWQPPSFYRVEWQAVLDCTGWTFPYDGVEWYLSVNYSAITPEGLEVSGYWRSGSNVIVIGQGWTYSKSLVRHEALHLLSRDASHDGWHWECEYGPTTLDTVAVTCREESEGRQGSR